MNFGNLMALRPLNDEKFILKNKDYDEVIEIAALRKVELDNKNKELDKLQKEFEHSLDKWQKMYYAKLDNNIELQKKYDELKKSYDVYENIAYTHLQELEEKIDYLEDENERLKLSLMTQRS